MAEALGDWDPYTPQEVFASLKGFGAPWWIAGGWALELFLGRTTRSHDDIDVELSREELPALADHLGTWEFHCAADGRLWLWERSTPVPDCVNSLWCREASDAPWRLQVMLTTVVDGRWVYRRDERISRRLGSVILESPDGFPYVAPEIQLLYKSKSVRHKDQADFDAVRGYLTAQQRTWLVEALDQVSPGHSWIPELVDSPSTS